MDVYIDVFNLYVMGSIQMLISFHFFAKFLKKQTKLIHYILFISIGLVFTGLPSESFNGLLLYILLLAADGIIILKGDICLSVLYSMVTVVIMQLCYGVFNSVLSVFYPIVFSFNPEIAGITFMILGNSSLLFSMFCYHIVNKYFLSADNCPNNDEAKGKYTFMILIPVFMMFLTGKYINSTVYGNTIITDKIGNIKGEHYQMAVIQLLGIASIFCVMFAYWKLTENFHLSREMSCLKQKEHYLYQYAEEAKTRYKETKAFRHDIKNHVLILRELLISNKWEQAIDYVEDMEDITETMSFPFNTNNPVIDMLLGNKLGMAEESNIAVSCSLILPYPCSIKDIDFCIILSNALDNAISACKRQTSDMKKYINVTGRMQGNIILIEIENSFCRKGVIHKGTGLKNIQAAAEKYNGIMSMKAQGAVFTLSVMLVVP